MSASFERVGQRLFRGPWCQPPVQNQNCIIRAGKVVAPAVFGVRGPGQVIGIAGRAFCSFDPCFPIGSVRRGPPKMGDQIFQLFVSYRHWHRVVNTECGCVCCFMVRGVLFVACLMFDLCAEVLKSRFLIKCFVFIQEFFFNSINY